MSRSFLTNVYYAYLEPDKPIRMETPPDLVDQGMTKSVRETLEQFARSGQTIDASRSNFSYADEFDDREPLDSERIDHLLDRPDFTGESEMEMLDFIRENTTEVNLADLQSKKSQKSSQPENQQVDKSSPSDQTPGAAE